jgi:hypothetical protein
VQFSRCNRSGGREGENSTRYCPSYSLRAGVLFAEPPDHRSRISGKEKPQACGVRLHPPCGVFTLRRRLYAGTLAWQSQRFGIWRCIHRITSRWFRLATARRRCSRHSGGVSRQQKLDARLDNESQRLAEKLPRLQDMLAAIERDAPKGLSAPLMEFNVYHRQALNSFVHGGIHALRRRQSGFPVELGIQLVTMSNALLHLAYRILADLGGGARMHEVTDLYRQYTVYQTSRLLAPNVRLTPRWSGRVKDRVLSQSPARARLNSTR